MMKTGKIRKALEEYNAITDGRKKKQKRVSAFKVLSLVEDKVKSPTQSYYFSSNDYSAHILEYVFYRVEDKTGVKGLRKLWMDRDMERKKAREDDEKYTSNIIDINRDLEVGDIVIDEDDGDEWIVLSVKDFTAEIRKRKGKKCIMIDTSNHFDTHARKEWYEADDGEDHNDDYTPLCFLTMYKDKNFKI